MPTCTWYGSGTPVATVSVSACTGSPAAFFIPSAWSATSTTVMGVPFARIQAALSVPVEAGGAVTRYR